MTSSLFERYTDRARRVLFFARDEAGRAGSPAVEPEHLLLALIREGKGLSARIFERARISPDDVRRAIESRTTRRQATSSGDDLPLSASTNRFSSLPRRNRVACCTATWALNTCSSASSAKNDRSPRQSLPSGVCASTRCATTSSSCCPRLRRCPCGDQAGHPAVDRRDDRADRTGAARRRVRSQSAGLLGLEGIPLKEMLSRLHDIQKERIELPPRWTTIGGTTSCWFFRSARAATRWIA